ncbi:response regulator transcription factor [bacterium]|nr:response regulator transcription factor [bacterium]
MAAKVKHKRFKVIIIEDHPLMRVGMKATLESKKRFKVVGEASTRTEAIPLLEKVSCDIVILDLKIEGGSELQLLKEIRRTYPKLPILVVSMYPENIYGPRVMANEANGYLQKGEGDEKLIEAVDAILSGSLYAGEKLFAAFVEQSRSQGVDQLTDREYEVFIFIARQFTNQKIAELMAIKSKTVSTYRDRILKKLGKKNNAEVRQFAIQKNLINPMEY